MLGLHHTSRSTHTLVDGTVPTALDLEDANCGKHPATSYQGKPQKNKRFTHNHCTSSSLCYSIQVWSMGGPKLVALVFELYHWRPRIACNYETVPCFWIGLKLQPCGICTGIQIICD